VSKTNVREGMLIEKIESEGGRLMAMGRSINGTAPEVVMDAWRALCGARRTWYLTCGDELESQQDTEVLDSDAHRNMVGPAQEVYEALVGKEMSKPIPAGCKKGLGQILYI